MARTALTVNGERRTVDVAADTPLLYVLREDLGLNGPQFGCGLAQCGACSVLVGKRQMRSCVTPVSAIGDRPVTTLEGMPALWAAESGARGKELHPLQQAWIDEQIPQCGYCQNGMIVEAAALLERTPHPSEGEIRTALDGHLCRCGTYQRIIAGVKRAAAVMAARKNEVHHA